MWGSAIAAVAPVLRAKEHEISIALATVFSLTLSPLVIFPPIAMRQAGPGSLWPLVALAIHDTSSVWAPASPTDRGPGSATTVKLARAL